MYLYLTHTVYNIGSPDLLYVQDDFFNVVTEVTTNKCHVY